MKRSILAVFLIAVMLSASMTALAQAKKSEKPPETAKDPVCGLTVEKNHELSATHKGETHYFCSRADMEKFKKEPDKHSKKK